MLSPTFQFHVRWPLSCFQAWRLHTHVIPQPLSTFYNLDTELSACDYDYSQSSLVLLFPSSCLLSRQQAGGGCGEEGVVVVMSSLLLITASNADRRLPTADNPAKIRPKITTSFFLDNFLIVQYFPMKENSDSLCNELPNTERGVREVLLEVGQRRLS
jgi:hypothetical protein